MSLPAEAKVHALALQFEDLTVFNEFTNNGRSVDLGSAREEGEGVGNNLLGK